LCENGESAALQAASLVAALRLPFATAVEVLSRLRSAREHLHLGAYAALAERFPNELAAHYQEALGAGVRPLHREQVVSALGFYTDGKVGLPQVLLAFDQDPAPRVRDTALMALGGNAPVADFQPRCMTAIEDSTVPRSLIVNALGNAATRVDANWLDQATRALALSAGITPQVAARIEQLRTQHLPGR
jgi:hypothetical protein